MTPQEAVAAFRALRFKIGSDAYISVDLALERWRSKDDAAFIFTLWVNGITSGQTFSVSSDDLSDLLTQATAKWAELKDEHRARRIREMALEIIRITAEHGVCTDAALRAGKFSDAEVTDLGPDACVDATEIALNGPFSITPLAKANAA